MEELFHRQWVPCLATAFLAGTLAGIPISLLADAQVRTFRQAIGSTQSTARTFGHVGLEASLCGILFAAYAAAVWGFGMHAVPEVQPDGPGQAARIAGHLLLLALLTGCTLTDLREYIIPDAFALPGIGLGILLATASGDSQLMHLWIDWNQAVPDLRGPFIPAWIGTHPHWHGLAWSLTGAAVGAGTVWIIRRLSTLILQQEAMGQGDVTLMAMIGSLFGWQAVILVLALAPVCGVTAGLFVRLITQRSFISFGPWLSMAAVLVLLTWRWLWQLEASDEFSIRKLFGDAPGLGILSAVSVTALALMLAGLRLYRAIPVRNDDRKQPH